MPPLVLTLICAISVALLVIAYNATYVDTTGVITVIADENGNVSFEVTADGYSKGGLHLLIGFDSSGAVCGISVLTIGETPGLGTKVQDPDYLAGYKGINTPDFETHVITGATFSSKGMKSAVTAAVNAYDSMKGEGLA